MQIDEFIVSNSFADFTQTIYINNNVTKIEPISYLETKEIINSYVKHYTTFQIICITSFAITIISLILYLVYKFKSIPKKLIVKYKKEEQPIQDQIVNDQTIVPENNIMLYPTLSA